MTPGRIWTALAVVYLLFFSWYTSCSGPLTEAEIRDYAAQLEERGATPDRLALWLAFMRADTGDDFAMLNALDLRDVPEAMPGVEPDETSAEVMFRYSRPFLGKALRSAAHPIFLGYAAAPAVDVWGIEGADVWDQGALVRYRSRRDLMDQVIWAFGLDIHPYKVAALEKTIAYPLDPFFYAGDPRLLLALLLTSLGLALHLRDARRRAPR